MEFQSIGENILRVSHREQELFQYVYRPDVPATESPKPYLHPLKTLGGVTVTDFRPPDHTWHHGLAMTASHLSGLNFWGGHSYVHGQGYVQLNNNGRIEHDEWLEQDQNGEVVRWREALTWRTPSGEVWLEESRALSARQVLPHAWELGWMSIFINSSQQVREVGSPTTQGRSQAGYGGLFWRGNPAFLNGLVRTEQQTGETALMGQPAPWLLYQAAGVSLLFIDQPTNPRYPNQWFVRTSEYPGVCWAFMFDTPFVLPPGEQAGFFYRLVLADGAFTEEQIKDLVDGVV